MLTHGGHDLEVAVVAGAVLRRRLADDLGEARAERAERRAADGDAGVGDRHPLAQQRLGPLDASGHEVGVGRLAVRGAELAREVGGRHERGARHGRDVEGLGVVAVHEVAGPAQVREVGELLRRHAHEDTGAASRSAARVVGCDDPPQLGLTGPGGSQVLWERRGEPCHADHRSITDDAGRPPVGARSRPGGRTRLVTVTGHGGTTSWRDLEDASTRLAAGYHQLGLEPGDRVASLMPNRARCSPTTWPASRRASSRRRSTTATPRPRSTTPWR